jgi:hypothetical protein
MKWLDKLTQLTSEKLAREMNRRDAIKTFAGTAIGMLVSMSFLSGVQKRHPVTPARRGIPGLARASHQMGHSVPAAGSRPEHVRQVIRKATPGVTHPRDAGVTLVPRITRSVATVHPLRTHREFKPRPTVGANGYIHKAVPVSPQLVRSPSSGTGGGDRCDTAYLGSCSWSS